MSESSPRKKKSKVRTVYNPKAIQRMHQAWELYCLGYSIFAISEKLGCHWDTSSKDIERAKAMSDESHLRRVENAREDAIRARRGLQQLALEDRAEAAPKDRAPLLGEARKNQQGIEELQQLHPKDSPVIQAGALLIQVGEGPPRNAEELSREEREQARLQIDVELADLPAPAPDESPSEPAN